MPSTPDPVHLFVHPRDRRHVDLRPLMPQLMALGRLTHWRLPHIRTALEQLRVSIIEATGDEAAPSILVGRLVGEISPAFQDHLQLIWAPPMKAAFKPPRLSAARRKKAAQRARPDSKEEGINQ